MGGSLTAPDDKLTKNRLLRQTIKMPHSLSASVLNESDMGKGLTFRLCASQIVNTRIIPAFLNVLLARAASPQAAPPRPTKLRQNGGAVLVFLSHIVECFALLSTKTGNGAA